MAIDVDDDDGDDDDVVDDDGGDTGALVKLHPIRDLDSAAEMFALLASGQSLCSLVLTKEHHHD